MAAFALMTSTANPAVGAAAANMDTAASRAKTLAANLDDTKVKLGDAFGPFINDVVLKNLNSLADWFKGWWDDHGYQFFHGLELIKEKFDEWRASSEEARKEWDAGAGEVSKWWNDTFVGESSFWENTSRGIKEVWDTMDGWWDNLVGWFDTARDAIGGFIDRIEDLFEIVSPLGSGAIKGVGEALHLPGFDTGGVVPGRIGAPMLAVVHGGETVLPTHKDPSAGARGLSITHNHQGLTGEQAEQMVHAIERRAITAAGL